MAIAELVEKETLLCVKCGACRSICPMLSGINREDSAPRGKIALARQFSNGEQGFGDRFNDAIFRCLLCMSCTEVCANRVRTDRIILAMRAFLKGKNNILDELSKFLESFAFQHPAFLSNALRFIQKIIMKQNYTGELQKLRFKLPGFNGRYFPVIRNRTFLTGVNEIVNGEKNIKHAFFVGCLLNLAYQGIADKTYKLIIKTGTTVVVPKRQICCGLPLLADGEIEKAREFGIQNMRIFEEVQADRIVVACASCGSMLKEYYPYIFNGTEHEEKAMNFARKIIDISELLVEEKFIFKKNGIAQSVTFHDPCHLKRGMGVHAEPREIIKQQGYELIEMNESDRCCGFSGSFSFKYPELSDGILKRKIENALSTGAETIVTGCPGCIMQLKSGVEREGANLKVQHLVELIE